MKSFRCVLVAAAIVPLLFTSLAAPAQAELAGPTRLLRYPDIRGDQVVFVYAGDLWTAAAKGGPARRLTAHPGDELYPKLSPDGKWIAFTGQYDGNNDVFVIPAGGGEPRRLTYHPSSDMVLGWSPDGRILFRSNRVSDLPDFDRLFLISPEGGVPEMLNLPRASLVSFAPGGRRLAFNYTSQEFRTWKRYRGGWKSPIAIWDLDKKTYEALPTTEAMDMFPMWHGEAVYFISDRDGVMNLYRTDLATKKVSELTRYAEYDIKWPSLGDSAIIYENGGLLHVYDLKTNEPRTIPITVASDETSARAEFKTVGRSIGGGDISPTGARAVVDARGDVFTLPAEHGSPRNLSATPGAHELSTSWSPDGRWIAYFSDRNGELELYIQPQMGGEAIQVTSSGADTRYLYNASWSPDSKKIAYSDKRLRLWYVDIDKKQPVLVDTAEYSSRPAASWSPDSLWLAYTKPLNGSGKDHIFLYSLGERRVHRVSEGFYDDMNPVFDPEGKYLYFLSARFFMPVMSALELRFGYHNMVGIFALTLKAGEPAPYGPQSDEEKAADEKKAEEKKPETPAPAAPAAPAAKKAETKAAPEAPPVKPIQIDFEGLASRVSQVPMPPGMFRELVVRKDKLFYLSVPMEAGELSAPGPSPEPSLHLFDVKKREDKVIMAGVVGFAVDKEGAKLLYASGDMLGIVDAAPGKKAGDGRLDTGAMQILSDPKAEWPELLREAWRVERDFYWDPGLGGADWTAIGKRYEALLPWVAHRSDLNYIIGEMIAELDTSHTYVGGGDMPDRKRVGVGLLGADLVPDNGFFRIARIYPGENWSDSTRSPLTEPGLKVKEGDYLIAVEGQPVRADREPYAYFQNMADRLVTLMVNDKPGTQGAWTILVRTIASEGTLRYLNWVEANRRKVDQATGGRVAYMHVPDTSVGGLVMFDKYFTGQLGKDGLIVDERYNHGGWSPDFYTEKLGRRVLLALAPREGKDFVPQAGYFGPKIMLVNERAGSGGDLFPYYFKKEKIGPLVGTRTWGGVIGMGGLPPMMDGSMVTAPGWAWWEPNPGGGWVVENYGVDPDVPVEQRPDLEVQGHDPQLEKAIELAKEGLKTMPPPLQRPPYPIKALNPKATKKDTGSPTGR
jgi:tricorn protease